MLISSGAEAQIFLEDNKITKLRPVKNYRLEVIDSKLRSQRTRREAKIIEKLSKANVPVPKILDVCKDCSIVMSFIAGEKVRDVLDKNINLSKQIGSVIGSMHALDIIHSDLTTSNMIFKDKVYLIDFGLSFISKKVEDKAVDLHLLFQALESRHYEVFDVCKKLIIEGYRENYSDADSILSRLSVVESRGRNKK